jgi:hypothetical protein
VARQDRRGVRDEVVRCEVKTTTHRLELAIKLLEKCIELVKKKEELSAKEFKDFVEPLFDSFEKVHAEYTRAFAGYRTRLAKGEESLSDIAAAIESDNILTAGQRINTLELAKFNPSSSARQLIEAIRDYLLDPSESVMLNADGVYPIGGQIFRRSLAGELRAIENEEWHYFFDRQGTGLMEPICELVEAQVVKHGSLSAYKKSKAIDSLDSVTLRMQKAYQRASGAYAQLRARLLSPR